MRSLVYCALRKVTAAHGSANEAWGKGGNETSLCLSADFFKIVITTTLNEYLLGPNYLIQ